ncbi:MAG: adenosylcobinamide-GDP ribazoletransferase [Candidatus Omnitrophica bacterium]|nr:adenosylcobinamide-GDP ribazoletransferase [Candidatus Omnitrophota bacterium]
MNKFLRAVGFLTVVPVPPAEAGEPPLASSAAYFPLVGACIGLVCYLAFWMASSFLPARAAVLILVFGPVVLSGGLHADGLADFCDGFFSSRSDREEVLRIMKDSRIGVMGALGTVFVILAKWELLVPVSRYFFLFLFLTAASRTVPVILASYLPYVGGPQGLGNGFVGQIARKDLAIALAVTLAFALPLGIYFTVIHAAALAFYCLLLGWAARKRIGGVTGDVLGAASEISEVWILGVTAWMAVL